MDTKGMLHFPRVDVPDDYREIYTTWHQVALIIPYGDLVWVQQASHFAAMASKCSVGWPTWGDLNSYTKMLKSAHIQIHRKSGKLNENYVKTKTKKSRYLSYTHCLDQRYVSHKDQKLAFGPLSMLAKTTIQAICLHLTHMPPNLSYPCTCSNVF